MAIKLLFASKLKMGKKCKPDLKKTLIR